MGKNTVKVATQVNGHSLKLYIYILFEKSQVKHNSLDCHNLKKYIFH
jgi:hypothetical protein